MKQKLFTLLTLLVLCVTGAWGQTTVDVKDFTLTEGSVTSSTSVTGLTYSFGNCTWTLNNRNATIDGISFTKTLNGGSTPTVGSTKVSYDGAKKVPTAGAYILFEPSINAKIKVYTYRGGSRNFDVVEKDGTSETGSRTALSNSGSTGIEFNVSAGKLYYVYFASEKINLYGFTFTPSAAKAYTVTAASNNTDYGTAAANDASLDEGETTTVTATPKTGYEFTSWSVEGTGAELSSTTTNPTTLTMGTANATVTATFSAIDYAITHNDATGGTYTIKVGDGEAVSTNTTANYGQTITLAGTPTNPAETAIAWNVKDADNADVTVTNNQFTMPAKAVTISPVFSEPAVLNTLFSMTNITGITNSTDNNKIGSVTATISDGSTVEVYNNGGNASSMLYNNSINLNGSGSNYVHITLPTKLVKGDVITATFLSDGQKWKIGTTSNKNNASSKTNPYELVDNDAFIGATDLYFFKENAAQIRAITIKGVGQVSDLAVTSSTTPTFAIGATSDITISSSSTGAVTYTSSDESVAKVSSTGVITGVGGGTTTITVNQDADETYRAGYATINVTVLEPALIKVKLNGGTSATVTGAIGGTADVNVQSDKKFGSSSYAGFTLANSETLHTGDVINVKITQASSSGSGTIAIYDSDKSTVLYDTGVKGVVGDNKFVLPAAVDGKGTIYICRTSANGWNAFVDYIAVYRPDAVVTLNASGFATFSNAEDFEFAGADAYKMLLTTTSLAGTKVETAIPAGEGILFKGTAGDLVAIMNTTGAPAITGNSLHATTTATDNIVAMPSGKTIFVLDPTGDTFKKYTGTAFVANKAFFQIDGDNVESRILTMTFDDGSTTAISGIEEVAPATMKTRKVVKNGRLVIETANGEYTVSGARVK